MCFVVSHCTSQRAADIRKTSNSARDGDTFFSTSRVYTCLHTSEDKAQRHLREESKMRGKLFGFHVTWVKLDVWSLSYLNTCDTTSDRECSNSSRKWSELWRSCKWNDDAQWASAECATTQCAEMVLCNWPPVSIKMTITKAEQLCKEVQVGVTQEEEEEPEEMGWCLTWKYVLAIPI